MSQKEAGRSSEINVLGVRLCLFEGKIMADRVLAEQVHTKPLVLLPKQYEDMSLIAIIVNKEGGIEMFSNGTQSKEKAYDALSKCLKEVEETKNKGRTEIRPEQAWIPPAAVGCD